MATKSPIPIKLPKSLAQCADLLYETRQTRLQEKKTVDAYQALESAIKEKLINELPKGDASGISGKVARVSVTTKDVPQLKDWESLCKFVLKHAQKHKGTDRELEMFSLFQRTIVTSMVEDLWAQKVKVPGVEPFKAVVVSCVKV